MINKKLTLEQKIVYFLAERGLITNAGEVFAALRDFTHAEKMLTVEGDPGLKDDIANAIISGEIEGGEECDHESLSNEEIQEVFDNDNDNKNK